MVQRDWVLEHIRRYQASDGADGHQWRGVDGQQALPCLLLTTTGRLSGEERTTPLIYGRDGATCIVVASRGGTPADPLWYRNLVTNPAVRLQVGADKFAASARTASADARGRLWQLMAEIFPTYNHYQEKTEGIREIPVVILERT